MEGTNHTTPTRFWWNAHCIVLPTDCQVDQCHCDVLQTVFTAGE